jgi:hypothetical protein
MLFNSFHFVFFFVVVTTLYFLLPHRFSLPGRSGGMDAFAGKHLVFFN